MANPPRHGCLRDRIAGPPQQRAFEPPDRGSPGVESPRTQR